MAMELHVPVPFDLDEEVVFLEQDGNMRHVAARQILLGKENAHTEWICKNFSCRCRLVDTTSQAWPSASRGESTFNSDASRQPGFVLDRGTEANLQNARTAVNALIDAAMELIDTLQATENRVLELTNDVSFIRWYEAERDPESQESRKAIVAQIYDTLIDEKETQEVP